MKLIKQIILVTLCTAVPFIAYSGTPTIESTSHYVVSPGTRLIAGDRKLNEFYILGARTPDPVATRHVGVRAKIVKREKAHKMKVAINNAFHHPHHHHIAMTHAHHTHHPEVAVVRAPHHHHHLQRVAMKHRSHHVVV